MTLWLKAATITAYCIRSLQVLAAGTGIHTVAASDLPCLQL
jgi:hypothetical protein